MKKQKTHKPERMCVICRRRFLKKELNRYVIRFKHDKAMLDPDPEQQLAGRGFYLCQDPDCQKRFPKFKGWQKYSHRGCRL